MAKKGSESSSMLLDQARFFVDSLHLKGHVEPACNVIKYHSDIPRFIDAAGVNTEWAEQALFGLVDLRKLQDN